MRAAYAELRGHYAFVAMHADEPQRLVGARKECPLVAGVGEGETFLASAIPAFLADTRIAMPIENGEIVEIEAGAVRDHRRRGQPGRARPPKRSTWDADAAEKGGYETFMLKEIHEQADAVAETITDRLPGDDGVDLSDVELSDEFLRGVRRIVIVACGTSYHAGLVGRYAIEEWARVPVEMDIASEYRYRNPVVGPERPGDRDHPVGRDRRHPGGDAARPRGRRHGAGDHQHHGQPGDPRRRRRPLHPRRAGDRRRRDQDLRRPGGGDVPAGAADRRAAGDAAARAARRAGRRDEGAALEDGGDAGGDRRAGRGRSPPRTATQNFFLYLGRHIGLPVCLEGALKLKEISYIPTDAYAAGEMKHGPIALLDESTPVICVATDSPVLEKVLSNVEEVRARGAQTIAIATAGDERVAEVADETIEVAATDWILQPIVAILPLQLLAYDIARDRGLNVDQPRNLAKTVTVE